MTRLWRYEVTEVWGDNPTVAVGQIVVDCWKGRRGSWDVLDMTTGKLTWGWSGCTCSGRRWASRASHLSARRANRAERSVDNDKTEGRST